MEHTTYPLSKLLDFGVALHLMSYYGELDMCALVMSHLCKKSRETFLTFHKEFVLGIDKRIKIDKIDFNTSSKYKLDLEDIPFSYFDVKIKWSPFSRFYNRSNPLIKARSVRIVNQYL